MRGSRRLVAAAVCVLFFGAVVEAHVHRASVRHGFCTEHGEPIHLSRVPGIATAMEHIAIGHAPDPARGEHDCAELRFLSQGADGQVDVADVEYRLALALDSFSPVFEPPPTIALLELAPKGSPPSA